MSNMLLALATCAKLPAFPVAWGLHCTAASPFNSSVWAEALAATGVDGADPPVRAAAFALRWVPTILLWGSGRMSALDLYRWSQNGAWLFGYVDSWRPSPPSKRCSPCSPSWANCCTMFCSQCSWSLVLPRATLCVSGGWPALLLALPMPQSATLRSHSFSVKSN